MASRDDSAFVCCVCVIAPLRYCSTGVCVCVSDGVCENVSDGVNVV